MKFWLTALCVIAVAVCMSANVYAETQSVKVSGDLGVRGIAREAYTLNRAVNEANVTRVGVQSDWQQWIMSTTEVQVDADMTDNVSTTVRLINQRDWNVQGKAVAAGTGLAVNGLGGYTGQEDEFGVNVDLAYVTLKDFIYQPLTLSIGRQDLWIGKGFIVGANQQNLQGTPAVGGTGGNLAAPEYTAINSFDSIKAVLDYDPWTITSIYAKIWENAIQAQDDVDLYGVNVGYVFGQYNADVEGYWFLKNDNSIDHWGPIKYDNEVHTIGLRGSVDPIQDLTLNAEGAFQFGQYVGMRMQTDLRDRSAWAMDLGADWRYFMEKFSWKPRLGAEYVVYSGNDAEENPIAANGSYEGWDPMYRGKFDSAIREFVGRYYATAMYPANVNTLQTFADASFTNQHQVIIRGSVEPIESVILEANYNMFYTYVGYLAPDNGENKGLIGQEVDLQATWDYTEDVSFGLLSAWFFPGRVYDDEYNTAVTNIPRADDIATDIVGSMKVSF